VCSGVTIAAHEDIAGIEAVIAGEDGSIARTVILGATFVIAGLAQLAAAPRQTFPRRST
jgi:hypothetical protein